jgi:hypothetical protein
MKFFKKYWIGITVGFAYIFNEVFHLLFKNVYFKTKILPCGHEKVLFYKTPIYYFGLSIFLVYLGVIMFVLIKKSKYKDEIKRGLKTLISTVITWGSIEMYQEFCYLAKINEDVLFFNPGLWGQIALVLSGMLLVYFTHRKSKS